MSTNASVDPLAQPSQATNNTMESPSTLLRSHMKTYTAGEDASRLAAAAKEFGLLHRRQPRPQVRRQIPKLKLPTLNLKRVWNALTARSAEESRMLSIYSFHRDLEHIGFDEDLEEDDVEVDNKRARMSRLSMVQIRELRDEERDESDGEDEDEYVSPGGTLTAAVLGIIKGMVGPAILYLPHGFVSAGYAVALPVMVFTTVLFLYSCSCLLSVWKHEQEVENQPELTTTNANNTIMRQSSTDNERSLLLEKQKQRLTIATNASRQQVLLSYPELAFRAFGTPGETLIKTGIALMQSGVCLTYLIFVPQNLHTSMKLLFNYDASPSSWLIFMLLTQIPLSWIRDIRKLTTTNLLANALILYGLVTCLAFAMVDATSGPRNNPWSNLMDHVLDLKPFNSNWIQFIGTSVLLFEGSITLLVPMQEAVETKSARKKFPQVFNRVILSIIVFYGFFGMTCYMAFGQDVKVVLTTSLPAGILATSVQLAYSVAVIFTFPLQNFPALEITCRTIQSFVAKNILPTRGSVATTATNNTHTGKPSRKFLTRRNVISSVLVALLGLIAVCTMDALDKVVSLMGSLLGIPIAFVFPPLIHSTLMKKANQLTVARQWINGIVAVVGLLAMAVASFVTLVTWR